MQFGFFFPNEYSEYFIVRFSSHRDCLNQSLLRTGYIIKEGVCLCQNNLWKICLANWTHLMNFFCTFYHTVTNQI